MQGVVESSNVTHTNGQFLRLPFALAADDEIEGQSSKRFVLGANAVRKKKA